MKYLKENNCLRDKLLQFSQIFAKFVKLNGIKKKKFFFSLFRISKTKIFTLGSRSIGNGHVKNILQDIKQYK